jgi:hypothetical protein
MSVCLLHKVKQKAISSVDSMAMICALRHDKIAATRDIAISTGVVHERGAPPWMKIHGLQLLNLCHLC